MKECKWIEAGDYLRSLRKDTGLSLFKVAKSNHISGNYLSLLERGKQSPSDTVIYNLSHYYEIPPADLFKLYGKLEPQEKARILSAPQNLRVLLTQLSIDKRLSETEVNDIYDELHRLTTELQNKHEE